MRPLDIVLTAAIIALSGVLVHDLTKDDPPPTPASSACAPGIAGDGRAYHIRSTSVPLLSGPDYSAAVVGRAIDSSVKVVADCKAGDWTKIHVSTPPTWRHHVGWIPSYVMISEEQFDISGFDISDIAWDRHTMDHQDLVIHALNVLRKEHPLCGLDILHGSVTLSGQRGSASDPVFFVPCGPARVRQNVYFSYDDIGGLGPP